MVGIERDIEERTGIAGPDDLAGCILDEIGQVAAALQIPDMDRVQAFLADASHGVTYRPNIWHHELTVFEEPAKFNIFMWRDQTASDEEFFQVPPFWVTAS